MAEVDAGQGVRVRTPNDVEVRVVQDGAPLRGTRRASRSAAAGTNDLRDILTEAGFVIAAEVELAPQRRGTRALRSDSSGSSEIEVAVSPSESALILVESAGAVYAWAYPRQESRPPRRRASQRTLVFSLAPPAASQRRTRGSDARSGRRGPILDWIGDKLVEPVRAYVLKFAVNAIVDVAVDFLEGDKAQGLISLAGDDASLWRPSGAPLPRLSQDKPANILLMVHGTFSSTAGGFGHLLLSDEGRSFLAGARKKYDAILAFDHKTLEVDPQTNATALMDALHTFGVPKDSSIDVVAHSRGGLVYRTFAEQVLPQRRPDIKLGKAVFVGCTNAGTHLAEPENWAAMVDLYTNAIMAATRVALAFTGGATLSPLVSGGIKIVGRFVQMLSEVAVTDARVPGLAAMQPTSATIKSLNLAEGGLERLATYYAVTSNFAARLEPHNGITKELAELILDRVTNRLFKVDNDLVVDTESMITFGTRKSRLEAGGTFTFGTTDDIYHTIYFVPGRVPIQLAEWLELPAVRTPPGTQGPSDSNETEGRSSPPKRETRHSGGGFGFESLQIRKGDRPTTTQPPLATALESTRPATSASAKSSVACHFAAEMEPSPPLKKRIPLNVTIAREKIDVTEGETAKTTADPVKLDASREIEVEVIARKNCRVVGEALAKIDAPDEKHSEKLRFSVEGNEKGVADILVEARQGARILVSFVLAPVFVEADDKPLRVSQTASATPEGPDEPAVLRIYEIVDNGRVTLRFDLTSRNPNVSVSESRTLPAGFSRDVYVSDIFREIEGAWLASSRIYDQFLLRLKANGEVMANELLPDKVREALWRHRDAIRAIQVISEDPFIPWELLYVTDPKAGPEGKGFLSEWGLVRWLHNTRWPGRRLPLSKDRVRYVIPVYVDPDLALKGATEEREMLVDQFENAKPVQADSIEVARFLQHDAQDCDILHFACHGEIAQRAVMRADLLMTGTQLDGRFHRDSLEARVVKTHARFAADGPGPIVFINACQTGQGGTGLAGLAGFVDAFLRPSSENGAGALIGALWSVDDKLAFTFAQSFYGALKEGKTLVAAAQAAREASQGQNDLTWLAYTVYGDPFARASATVA
jgi:CHAT domain